MTDIPTFRLYGDDDPRIEAAIQPRFPLRDWGELSKEERQTILQELVNLQWLGNEKRETLWTVRALNFDFLQLCPGKRLHRAEAVEDPNARYGAPSDRTQREAALEDFEDILVNHESSELVYRMLSQFALVHIDNQSLERAKSSTSKKTRAEHIKAAFKKFDQLARCLNRIFMQFCVNMRVTRSCLIPMQDDKVVEEIYVPTLEALSDPKWKAVSEELSSMFNDFREGKPREAIAKAHNAVQRFLQIAVGEEGENAKGQIGKLFGKAKDQGIIPGDAFVAPLIAGLRSSLESARATKSSAKPSRQGATLSDALLVMNVAMVFIQYCLQTQK